MEQQLSVASQCTYYDHKKYQFGSLAIPIFQSSCFQFDDCDQGGNRFAGQEEGFIYTRLGNPTVNFLEEQLAKLEGGEEGCVLSSGMGAISSTLLTILSSGDHIVADKSLYGCTFALFKETFPRFGIQVDFIDASIPGEVSKKMKDNTKVVYFESPTNPTLKIIDIKRVANEAHSHRKGQNVIVILDNTFCSPIITKGLDFGADVVLQSMTKYINGHADVIGGVVVSRDRDLINRIKMMGRKDITGSVFSPHDAFLVCRGLKTLDLRVRKSSENALIVAEFLNKHPAVQKVYYPGLKEHLGHDIAKKQMKLFGGMITFELKGGLEAGKKLLNNLKLIILAVSLGGCESLIQHPASMTHSVIPKEEREAADVTDGLIRFSVGIECPDDIIADLKQALDKL